LWVRATDAPGSTKGSAAGAIESQLLATKKQGEEQRLDFGSDISIWIKGRDLVRKKGLYVLSWAYRGGEWAKRTRELRNWCSENRWGEKGKKERNLGFEEHG
jgi:hypothetical protein